MCIAAAAEIKALIRWDRLESGVPPIRLAVLRVRDWLVGQRACDAGNHPPLCGGSRQVFREREWYLVAIEKDS